MVTITINNLIYRLKSKNMFKIILGREYRTHARECQGVVLSCFRDEPDGRGCNRELGKHVRPLWREVVEYFESKIIMYGFLLGILLLCETLTHIVPSGRFRPCIFTNF
jgi:hypothetical protein